MKYVYFLCVGVFFGIIMTKSEAVSWFRIQEMFRFDSFHMYGIILSALATGIAINLLIKKRNIKTFQGENIHFTPKEFSIKRYLIGGIIFGIGWAFSGVCPGPIYTLIGAGITTMLITLLSAILGTLVYGFLRKRLPH